MKPEPLSPPLGPKPPRPAELQARKRPHDTKSTSFCMCPPVSAGVEDTYCGPRITSTSREGNVKPRNRSGHTRLWIADGGDGQPIAGRAGEATKRVRMLTQEHERLESRQL